MFAGGQEGLGTRLPITGSVAKWTSMGSHVMIYSYSGLQNWTDYSQTLVESTPIRGVRHSQKTHMRFRNLWIPWKILGFLWRFQDFTWDFQIQWRFQDSKISVDFWIFSKRKSLLGLCKGVTIKRCTYQRIMSTIEKASYTVGSSKYKRFSRVIQ